MGTLRRVLLVLVTLAAACTGDEGDEGAGLFGEGGEGPPAPTDDGGTSSGTTSGSDTGQDEAPTPPATTTGDTGEDDTSGGPAPGTDSSDGGSTGPGSSSDGTESGDTYNDGTLDVQVVTQSMFPQGQCDDVTVTNVSAMAVTWEVELPLPGTIDQLWNAMVVETPGMGVFTGVDFNATLDPGEQAMFGYCVLY